MKLLVEGRDELTRAEWIDHIGIDAETWTGLLENGVFTPVRDGSFRLTFVGFVALPSEFLIAFPKYTSKEDASAAFELQETLAHYFGRSDSRRAVVAEDEQVLIHRDRAAFTEYELWLTLRAWYWEQGLYVRRIRERDENWGRSVDWPRTLGRTLAVHADQGAVYPAPVMVRHATIVSDVTQIQISILAALENKYRLPSEPPISMEHRAAYARVQDRLDTDRSAFALRVARELNQAYRGADIALLTTMHSWLVDDRAGLQGTSAVRLFGTSGFEYVWEDACRVVLGNGPTHVMPAPFWTIRPSPVQKKAPSRPDLWSTLPGNKRAILDAKYYYPVPDSVPGWDDVVKQLFYSLALDSLGDVVNGFLFPDPDTAQIANRGFVDVRDSTGKVLSQFGDIQIFALNPSELFARYRSNAVDHSWLAVIGRTP